MNLFWGLNKFREGAVLGLSVMGLGGFDTIVPSPQEMNYFKEVKYLMDVAPGHMQTLFRNREGKIYEWGKAKTKKEWNIKNVESIVAGSDHFMILTSDGKVYAMNRSLYGQLGLGDFKSKEKPTRVTFFDNKPLKSVCCGYLQTYFLCKNGDLYTCGRNHSGQLGLGDYKDKHTPTLCYQNVERVYCGVFGYHFFFITKDGKVMTCGRNEFGQLGLDNQITTNEPIQILDFEARKIRQFCSALQFSVMLYDGQLYSCGKSDLNGLGKSGHALVFTLIPDLAEYQFQQASVGSGHALALTKDNILWCWGRGSEGQLGLGTKSNGIRPVTVPLKKITEEDHLKIVCGAYNSYLYYLQVDPLIDDMRLLLKRKEQTDEEIGEIPVHKILVELRTGKSLKEIKEFFKSTKKSIIKDFLLWVYTGTIRNKNVEQSSKGLGIENFEEKSLKNGLVSDFEKFFNDEDSKDFTIKVGKKCLRVHKFIMIARSNLYREMFLNTYDNTSEITDYTGKSSKTLLELIHFFYTDNFHKDLNKRILKQLEDASEYYMVSKPESFDWKLHVIKRDIFFKNN
ncbi:regulator of chromosome condensation [Anaeramoeba flamelloides]|uniref:Regulator of chromosome condensation n=1 Tax=Anaeramoeba flamelloides TaxID=1746091 RepID=A0ABQ8XGH1_9EUKA|nr:regulator of chromosome condensation [Anaeramoeba flamelloides]